MCGTLPASQNSVPWELVANRGSNVRWRGATTGEETEANAPAEGRQVRNPLQQRCMHALSPVNVRRKYFISITILITLCADRSSVRNSSGARLSVLRCYHQLVPCFKRRALSCRRLQLLYFQYEVCLGAYVFEWWEKIFIFFIFASVFAVIAAAVYKQTATVLAYATWHWTHHASKWWAFHQLPGS